MPFMVLLMGFFATTAYKKYETRRDIDSNLYKV